MAGHPVSAEYAPSEAVRQVGRIAFGKADPQTPVLTGGPASPPLARRGTSNANVRGSSETRRRRREWLVETYRANRDVTIIRLVAGTELVVDVNLGTEGAQSACRCYRCGLLLTVDTVTVDRILPGCRGGSYRRDNIRPCCSGCNSETGGSTRGRTKR